MTETARRSIEDAIERLLALLDALDGDPDLEDGADTEPNGDELESTLGSDSDLEFDYGYYDPPGFLRGGQGL
jgi:hypothetical protein